MNFTLDTSKVLAATKNTVWVTPVDADTSSITMLDIFALFEVMTMWHVPSILRDLMITFEWLTFNSPFSNTVLSPSPAMVILELSMRVLLRVYLPAFIRTDLPGEVWSMAH